MDSRPSTPPPPYSPTHLGPFLTFGNRLFLALISYPVIALAFVAFRFYLAALRAHDLIDDSKAFLIASCLAAQRAATVAVSMPRWMALNTNEQIQKAAISSINASRDGLNLTLTGLENIIVFVIDTYKAFYLCLFQLLIRAGLAGAITIIKYVEKAFDDMAASLDSAANTLQNSLNTAIGGINSALGNVPGFGDRATIPTITINSSSLSSVSPPDSWTGPLNDLNNKLPTLNDLRAALANLISTPFNALKGEINSTFAEVASTFNAAQLPLPAVRTVQFCNNVDTSIVDDIGGPLVQIAQTSAFILIGLVVLFAVANVLIEWYRYRQVQATINEIREQWTDPAAPRTTSLPTLQLTDANILTLNAQLEQTLGTRTSGFLARVFKLQPQSRDTLAWFIAYTTYPPALMCLLIGAVGIAATLIQLALIQPLENRFANAEGIIIGNFTQNIESEITNAIGIDSAAYAAAVNKWLDDTTATVNNDLFGFATTASNAVNNTIVQFYQQIENGVHATFDGTAFATPIIEFLRCAVGNKVFALERGLAWLKENLSLRLPRVAPDVLALGAGNVSELASPVSAAAALGGDGSGNRTAAEESGIMARAFESYRSVLRGEVYMFAAFLGAYVLVVLIAIVLLVFKSRRSAAPEPTEEREVKEKPAP